MKKNIVILIGVSVLLNGCATLEKTTLLGTGIGIAAGTGFGLAASNDATGALAGAAIGGLVIGGMAYLSGKAKEDKDRDLKDLMHSKDKGQDLPFIKSPQAKCVRLDERIEGSVYLGPQLKCTIENQAVWTR